MGIIKINGYICERCDHKWVARHIGSGISALPIVCPKCKSPYWNRPKKEKKKEEKNDKK